MTLDLTITNCSAGTDIQESCDCYTWIDNNTYLSNNNTATYTLTNAAGCDSIVNLDLTINRSFIGIETHTACDSFTWIDGITYTKSINNATHILTNAAGCDSLVILNLTIGSNTGTDTQTACNSFTWIDGNTYTESNSIATHTLMNAAGCDSIITLNLTIGDVGTDTQSACDSYFWIDGNTYTESNNIATHTLINSAGCDSIVTLNLTINNSSTGIDTQTACDSYTWIDGNTYTENNYTATHTIATIAGCDSIVTLNLSIKTVDVNVTEEEVTLIANANGAIYQWINCNGNLPIEGENSSSFTATTDGEYAVIVDNGDCVDTSLCYTVIILGVTQTGVNSSVLIYPNPTKGIIFLETENMKSNQILIEIININGQIVYKKLFNSELLKERIDLSEQIAGIYIIKIKTDNLTKTIKLIKEE